MPSPPGPQNLNLLTDGPETYIGKKFADWLTADPILGAIFTFVRTENLTVLDTFSTWQAALSLAPVKFKGFPSHRDTAGIIIDCALFLDTEADEISTQSIVTNLWNVWRKRVNAIIDLPSDDDLKKWVVNVGYEWNGLTFPRDKGDRVAIFRCTVYTDIDPVAGDFSEG